MLLVAAVTARRGVKKIILGFEEVVGRNVEVSWCGIC